VLVKSLFLPDKSVKTVKIIFMTKLIFKKIGLFLVLFAVASLSNGVIQSLLLQDTDVLLVRKHLLPEVKQIKPNILVFLSNGLLLELRLII